MFFIVVRRPRYTAVTSVNILLRGGIVSVKFEKLDEVKDWLEDDEPCLMNIMLPEATVLLPKMNWNDKEMKPLLEDSVMEKARVLLA